MAHLVILGRPSSAECSAAEHVASQLDDGWLLAANLQAGTFGKDSHGNKSFQVDLLALHPAGVILCEFKNVDSAKCFLNHSWELPGQTPANFYSKGEQSKYQLFDWLRQRLGRDVKRDLNVSHAVFFSKRGAQVEIGDDVLSEHVLTKDDDIGAKFKHLLSRKRKSDTEVLRHVWSVVRNDEAFERIASSRGGRWGVSPTSSKASEEPSLARPEVTRVDEAQSGIARRAGAERPNLGNAQYASGNLVEPTLDSIAIEDVWTRAGAMLIGLRVVSGRQMPLVVGCSLRSSAGEIDDRPARILKLPGSVLWGVETFDDRYAYGNQAPLIRNWKGQVKFALWDGPGFRVRLADTDWVGWTSCQPPLGSSVAGLNLQDSQIRSAMATGYSASDAAWARLNDRTPISVLPTLHQVLGD